MVNKENQIVSLNWNEVKVDIQVKKPMYAILQEYHKEFEENNIDMISKCYEFIKDIIDSRDFKTIKDENL
jgi:hypothetical protein